MDFVNFPNLKSRDGPTEADWLFRIQIPVFASRGDGDFVGSLFFINFEFCSIRFLIFVASVVRIDCIEKFKYLSNDVNFYYLFLFIFLFAGCRVFSFSQRYD